MTLKLIKTNTLPKCTHCQGTDFVKTGPRGWACNRCHTFVWPVLFDDIKNKRGAK
jgi:ribosomal protein L37AE/L43A